MLDTFNEKFERSGSEKVQSDVSFRHLDILVYLKSLATGKPKWAVPLGRSEDSDDRGVL